MSKQTVNVQRDIRAERRAAAGRFRQEQARRGTLVVRLLSAPGTGKTTLLEKTAETMRAEGHSVGVLVGDVETNRDAERLAPFAPSVQITTGGACHLELPLIEQALANLTGGPFEFLFIEDIGNLICPASHELGEHVRVVMVSTTEGDDKPGKYPKAFRTSQVAIVSKLDLLPHVPFSVDRVVQDALDVQPQLTVFPLCALSGEGMDAWYQFLQDKRQEILAS